MATIAPEIALKTVSHWIGGKVVASASGRYGTVWNPATGEAEAHVDFADAREVDLAVDRAQAAFPEWRATPLSRRAETMFRLRELVDANRREIAALITLEHGKTQSDAMGEVARGLENIEFACGIPNLLKGGFSEQASRGVDVYQIRQPLGVVAGHHAVQLPGHGSDVDVSQRHCLRQHFYPETFGERPVGEPVACGIDAESRRPRWRVQRGAGRSRGGRPSAGASRDQSHQLRRIDARRQSHLRSGHAQRQARAGAGRREEPHGRIAGCGYRHGGGCRGLRRLRLGRRTLHVDLRGGGRERRRRSADRRHQRTDGPDQNRRGLGNAAAKWGR